MIFFEWRYFEGNKIDIHMILHYIDRFPHFVRKPEIQFYAHDIPLLSNKFGSLKNIQIYTREQ